MVAPVYGQTTAGYRGDYEDHRVAQQSLMTEYDDPYGRVVYRAGQGRRPSQPALGTTVHHHMPHSLSHPRIQSHQGKITVHYT